MKILQLAAAGLTTTLLTLTAGCSTPMIEPSALPPPKPAKDLQLSTPIVYKFSSGLAVLREVVLLPGTYKGVGEDGKGVWYLGNRESMTNTVVDRGGATGYAKEWVGVPTVSSGGIFVPNDPALTPQIFRIHGEQPSSAPGSSRQVDKLQENQVPITFALNAQPSSPALANSSVMQAGVNGGVASGVVAGIIEMDKADYGKYQIHEGQPVSGVNLRQQFSIITSQ
ncbi:hypothetical protein GJ699_27470 [Duganella sp. FT80W]|uniref:Lipoprotein n=1 Tax=Duganella guangzhouensis TaxID=2666084 RepID=A0A6I2L7L0_9BURK|nr:hypothetical protein [Duganella guangzhouensis]MRW93740.1 hypothetical protein [Duganella guangzhouensis]